MKKLSIIIILAIMTLSVANGQFTKLGGGATYGTGFHVNNETGFYADLHQSPHFGIFLTGIYELSLPIHIAPSFAYFIPRTNESTAAATNAGSTKVSAMMFDINGHYVFNSLNRFEFYGLAGLNITFTKIKWIGTTSSGSDNAIGLNLGAGSYIKLSPKYDLSVEAKYIVSKYDQLMINVGFLVNIYWIKQNEKSGL
jgi:opacity protein-like surface antigen